MTNESKSVSLLTVPTLAILLIMQLPRVTAQPSIMDRIMTVTDPELTECIRTAVLNLSTPEGTQKVQSAGGYNQARLQTIREVTESYSKIKLLDSQIAQVRKTLDTNMAKELANELALAQAELESRLVQEIARLRESMCIVPRYAFGQIPLTEVDSWIVADVVDDSLTFIFEVVKPFEEPRENRRYAAAKLMSDEATLDYFGRALSEDNEMPLRIEVRGNHDHIAHTEQLYGQLLDRVKRASAELRVDIRLSYTKDRGARTALFAIGGRIGTSVSLERRAVEIFYGEDKSVVGQNVVECHIIENATAVHQLDGLFRDRCLSRPEQLPLTWVIEHDEESEILVSQVTARFKELAQGRNISSLVQVQSYPTKRIWCTGDR